MKYENKKWNHSLGESKAYRDNWDAIFGKKPETPQPSEKKDSTDEKSPPSEVEAK